MVAPGADFIHKRRALVIGFLHAGRRKPTDGGTAGRAIRTRYEEALNRLSFDSLQDVFYDCDQEQTEEEIGKALGDP